ncbi:MAG: MMPL family transporter, partial [Opitutales bacterium]
SLVSGLVITAALAMMLLEAFNMISIAFAVLFVGLGVDYAIHLCLRFREARHSCLTTAEALRTSLADLAPALALCALSTAAGFLSFALTDFKGVADLGIIASVGMVVSLGCTLTVVPGVAKLLRLKAVSGSPGGGIDSPVVFENTLAFGKRRRRSVRLVTLILAPVAVGALAWVDFDADPLKLRDPDSESVSTLRDLMADNALSPNDIEILADSPAAARVMAKRLQDVEGAGRVLSAFSFVPENQDTKLAQLDELNLLLLGTFFASSEPGNTGLKATREAANALRSALQADLNTATAERLVQTLGRLDERLKKPAGEGAQALLQRLDTALLGTFSQAIERLQLALEASPVTVDHLPAPLRSRWISPEGAYRIQVYPSETIETSEAKEALVAAVMRVAPTATGSLPTVLRAETVVASAFVQAFCSALVTIGVLLAVALRSLRDMLLVLLPLLLSAALTGAGCVLLGIDFNFANVIALPLLLGLGVDHGVHILHRLSGQDEGSAGVTARAVFFASLTTIFSFGNLAFSPHPGTASMGMVLTMGVLALLLTSLLVLPAFVPNRDPRREP